MGSDLAPDYLRGIGKPLDLTTSHIGDEVASLYSGSFTQASPVVGGVTYMDDTTSLRIRASGLQTDGTTLSVRTNRAAPHPGRFVWKPSSTTVSGVDWRGRDIAQVTGWQAVASDLGAYNQVMLPHAAALPDGSVVVALQTQDGGAGVFQVEVTTYTPKGSHDASGDSFASLTTLYDQVTSTSENLHPCCAVDPRTGWVYVAHWVPNNTINLANIRIHRSTDSGATWTTHSTAALTDEVDISSSLGSGNDGYDLGRLRMAISPNGQALIVGALVRHDTSAASRFQNALVQYASSDGLASFTQVDLDVLTVSQFVSAVAVAWDHDVMYYDGAFCVAGPVRVNGTNDKIAFIRLPHAYASVIPRLGANASTDLVDLGATDVVFDAAVTLATAHDLNQSATWADEDGVLYMAATARSGTTYPGHTFLLNSIDGGTSWYWTGDGDWREASAGANQEVEGTILDTGDATTYHLELAGCSTRGRQLLFTNYTDTAASTDDFVSMVTLGGYTTVEAPNRRDNPQVYQSDPWDEVYLPLEDLGNLSSITKATTGTASVSQLVTGLQHSTTTGTLSYTSAITATPSNGVVVLFDYTPTTGGSVTSAQRGAIVEIGDGSSSYNVEIRMDDTRFRVYDNVAAATVGTSDSKDAGTRTQILIAVANGKCSCWERDGDTSEDRAWTEVVSGASLTEETSSPASSSSIKWGHLTTGTIVTTWGVVAYVGNTSYTKAMAAGPTYPDDLHGREYPPRSRTVSITDGLRLSTLDGSPSEGEEYAIVADAEFHLNNVVHAYSPSPRVVWRSQADNVQQTIPIQLNIEESDPATARDGRLESDLIYVLLRNVNFSQFSIDYYQLSGGWSSFASFDTALKVGGAQLRNGLIELNTSDTNTETTTVHVFADEYAGCNVIYGVGSPAYYQITTHTAGVLDNVSDHLTPRFRVRGDAGSATIQTGTTLQIIPRDVLVVINTAGIDYKALRLNITAQHTYEDYYRMGALEVGSVLPFGIDPDWGRRLEGVQGTITDDAPDGTRRSTDLAPGHRRVQIGWPYGMEQSGLFGLTPDPDHSTASSVSGNGPVSAYYDVPYSLKYLSMAHGTGKPIVYIPSIKRSTAAVSGTVTPATQGEEAMCFVRRADFIHGYIDSPVEIESRLGEENRGYESGTPKGEQVLLTTWNIREIV